MSVWRLGMIATRLGSKSVSRRASRYVRRNETRHDPSLAIWRGSSRGRSAGRCRPRCLRLIRAPCRRPACGRTVGRSAYMCRRRRAASGSIRVPVQAVAGPQRRSSEALDRVAHRSSLSFEHRSPSASGRRPWHKRRNQMVLPSIYVNHIFTLRSETGQKSRG